MITSSFTRSAIATDVADTGLVFTGTPPFIKISESDGVAYAQKIGQVCSDLFTAAG